MLEELFSPNRTAETLDLLVILLPPKIIQLVSLKQIRSDNEAMVFATGGVITDPSSQRRQFDENNSHVQALRRTDKKIAELRTFIAKSLSLAPASQVDKLSQDELLAMVAKLKDGESSSKEPSPGQQPK